MTSNVPGADDPRLSHTVFVARGMAILLVLLGHAIIVAQMRFQDTLSTDVLPVFNNWIYSFHMHFFFFLSGWSMKVFGKDLPILPAFGKRLNRLLIPYMVFSAFVGVIKLFVPQFATVQVEPGTGVVAQVLMHPRSNPMSVLWFLYTMFTLSTIAVFTRQWLDRVPAWVLLIFAVAVQFVPKGENICGLKDLATFCLPFLLGYVFPGLWTRFATRPPLWAFAILIVSPILHFTLRDSVHRYLLMAVTGALGIPMILSFAHLVANKAPARITSVIARFGRLSLQVYLLSYFIEHGIRILILNVFLVSPPSAAFLALDLTVTPVASLYAAILIQRLPVLPRLLFGETRRYGK